MNIHFRKVYIRSIFGNRKKMTLSEMPQNNEISICFNQSDTENEYNMHMQYEKFSLQKLCKLDQSSKNQT